jgi:putative tricarboxylic transport membrane protein
MRRAIAAVAGFVVAVFAVSHAIAQGWTPEGNVELIVPASAGGSLDATGRMVHADSPITSGKALVEALKKDPTSLSGGLGSAAGGTHHIAIAMPLLSAGVDLKKLKLVSFNSSGEAVTALLGSHVDVISAGTINVAPHVEGGRLKTLATTAPQRLQGVFAKVPTWPEQGYKGVFENWRGVIGAEGITPQQTSFWEGTFKRVVENDEFKQQAKRNQWEQTFKGAAEMTRFLASQYADLKDVMGPLGLVK